ncbi:unnamed protein product [Polarella glacialis]|uniref:Secreted protein n=1 Tax=Polarella glacialis TaxID=89957 RepID=A0A813DMJ7_POLGL|nr:unnamed protein product [Polarella glacialis]
MWVAVMLQLSRSYFSCCAAGSDEPAEVDNWLSAALVPAIRTSTLLNFAGARSEPSGCCHPCRAADRFSCIQPAAKILLVLNISVPSCRLRRTVNANSGPHWHRLDAR